MSYDGGKGQAGVYQRIINQMPPHDVYIEGWLGAGAILRSKKPATWSIGIELDPDVYAGWQDCAMENLSVVNADIVQWLNQALPKLQPSTLIYLDPPYVMETRRSQRPIYKYEMGDDQHEALLGVARMLTCNVMISGYWSKMYGDLLEGWRTIHFEVMTRGGVPATEWLWMNFPEPVELHDYRYIGEDWRERERIKKKVNRWKARLGKMPVLERQALLFALSESDAGRAAGSRLVISDDDDAGRLATFGEAAR